MVSIAATTLIVFGTVALAIIFPTAQWDQLRDVIIFILFLPFMVAALMSVVTTLVAAGLAIYSIFKRGEKPLTIIAALLVAAVLIVVNFIFVTLNLYAV